MHRAPNCRSRGVLLAGVAALALLPLGAGAETPLSRDSGVTLSIEGRYQWTSAPKQPWAQFNQPFNVPGEYRTVGLGDAWSGRIAGLFRMAEQWDFGLAYTGLRSRTKSQRIGDPNNPAYQGFLLVPAIGDLRFGWFQGDVDMRARFDVVDFDAGFRLQLGARAGLRLFGGLRYAQYRQDVFVTLRSLAGSRNDETSEAAYWGLGPRLGVNADVAVFTTGDVTFGVHGGVAGAVLFGRGSKEINTGYFPAGVLAASFRSDDDYDRTVWTGEATLGAHIAFPFAGWQARLSVGYRGEGWWGLVNTRTVNPIQGQTALSRNEVLGTRSGNLYQHGPYLRFSVAF